MQVCCKSAGSRGSAWLGQAHLYSRVCRSSFWEAGVFLAWGIDVSTAIFEMHSKWAGIRDGVHSVPHSTLGSWAIVGNPRVAEWQIRQVEKSWRPRGFIFSHPLVPRLACRCWAGPQADDPLHSSLPAIPLTSSYRDPGQGRVDDGQWQVELIGERGYRLSAHLEAEEEMFPDGGIC